MNRRELLNRLTVVALQAIALSPLAVGAQQPAKVARIGILEISSASGDDRRWDTFRQRLRELGYVDGQNLVLERRFAEGKTDRLPELASELVRLKVDVIVTSGTAAARAAKNATSMVPIVIESADPVGTGLVASFARPGGNITGFSSLSFDVAGKRLELLKEVLPKLSRVAVLWNASGTDQVKEIEIASRTLGIGIQAIAVQPTDDLGGAFSAIAKAGAQALIVTNNPVFADQRGRIVDSAAKYRLPAIYGSRGYADAGGLMSYGSDIPEIFRRMASYVDRILKGAKPADLPVEQATKFELVINLKTARALGLTIPQSILVRADRVIE